MVYGRHRGGVRGHSIDKACHIGVSLVDLAGKAAVEHILLDSVEARWKHIVLHQRIIREEVAHISHIGIELVDNCRNDIDLHRIVYCGHLYKCGIDRKILLDSCGNLVGKEHILRLCQVLEIDHLSIVAQHLSERLPLFSIPLLLLRTTDKTTQ